MIDCLQNKWCSAYPQFYIAYIGKNQILACPYPNPVLDLSAAGLTKQKVLDEPSNTVYKRLFSLIRSAEGERNHLAFC